MKNLFIILLLLLPVFLPLEVTAQFTCATPTQVIKSNALSNTALSSATLQQASGLPQSDGSYSVNVFFHLLVAPDGVTGVKASSLPTLTNILSSAFLSSKIKIVNAGYDYISNFTYNPLGDAQFASLIKINNKANAVNIYLLYDNNAPGGRTDNVVGHSIAITYQLALTPVVAHELGHALGLFHTFHGQESGGCPERIDGTNCSTCGDYICDTPADPYSGGLYPANSDCAYTGGGGYNPDVTNFMCYALPKCLNHFTWGQSSRMINSILKEPVIQPVILTISGVSAFCQTSSYTINNLVPGEQVTWSVAPSGVVSLSSNGNTATLTKITQGFFTLTATVNGSTVTSYLTTRPDCTAVTANMSGSCNGSYQTWYLSATPNMAASNWHWTVDNPSSANYNIYNPYAQSTYVSVSGGGGGISVTYTDPCGETSYREGTTIYSPCARGYAFVAYPNPASSQLSVKFNTAPTGVQAISTDNTALSVGNTNFIAEIYDGQGRLLKKSQTKNNETELTFNTSDLVNGTYYLHIKTGTDLIEKQVYIKH